jgi:hypothetical protein
MEKPSAKLQTSQDRKAGMKAGARVQLSSQNRPKSAFTERSFPTQVQRNQQDRRKISGTPPPGLAKAANRADKEKK